MKLGNLTLGFPLPHVTCELPRAWDLLGVYAWKSMLSTSEDGIALVPDVESFHGMQQQQPRTTEPLRALLAS